MLRLTATLVALIVATVFTMACGDPGTTGAGTPSPGAVDERATAVFLVEHVRTPTFFNDFFHERATELTNKGATIYWLGEEFSVGDARFGDIGAQVNELNQGEIIWDYDGVSGVSQYAGLTFSIFTEGIEDADYTDDRYLVRDVIVAGVRAKMFVSPPQGTRPIPQRWLEIKRPDSFMIIKARSLGTGGDPLSEPDPTGAGDVNILIVEENFLAVLENLRPYPD